MLSKCANPRCNQPFRYLHAGKLFRIQLPAVVENTSSPTENGRKPPRRAEFFWLCHACSEQMTIVYKKDVGVITRPLASFGAGAGL